MPAPSPSSIADPFDRANALIVTACSGSAHPLERVWAASRAAEAIHELTEEAVTLARSEGASWSEIGDVLGMTKQSAWERYRHLPTREPTPE